MDTKIESRKLKDISVTCMNAMEILIESDKEIFPTIHKILSISITLPINN